MKIMQRARHDGGDDDAGHVLARIAFQREQLAEPHRIFVARAARIGCDAPAALDRPPVEQREDHVRVPGIDGKQHESPSDQEDIAGMDDMR